MGIMMWRPSTSTRHRQPRVEMGEGVWQKGGGGTAPRASLLVKDNGNLFSSHHFNYPVRSVGQPCEWARRALNVTTATKSRSTQHTLTQAATPAATVRERERDDVECVRHFAH